MDSNLISKIWPEWNVKSVIGKGSYGIVYEAVRKDEYAVDHAAIKVISIPPNNADVDSLQQSEQFSFDDTKTYFQEIVKDFTHEIKLMLELKGNPNIVCVEDYKVVEKENEIGWNILIRMELLKPLDRYSGENRMTEADIIKLGCDICTALGICEKKGIIHRDIKPENIFINDIGEFKIGDFGIAKKLEELSASLSSKGTFNYMAPEVARCKRYDGRADIYSLGLVLYRLLNDNKLPFLDTKKQILSPKDRQVAFEQRLSGMPLPKPCKASSDMAKVILCACAYDPDQRFSNATEMKEALQRVGKHTVDHMLLKYAKPVAKHPARNQSKEYKNANIDGGKSVKVHSFETGKTKTHQVGVFILALSLMAFVVGAVILISTKPFRQANKAVTDMAVTESDIEGEERAFSDKDPLDDAREKDEIDAKSSEEDMATSVSIGENEDNGFNEEAHSENETNETETLSKTPEDDSEIVTKEQEIGRLVRSEDYYSIIADSERIYACEGEDYVISKIDDSDPTTAWAEYYTSVRDDGTGTTAQKRKQDLLINDGIGSSISYFLHTDKYGLGQYTIYGIEIMPGYQKSIELYEKNGTPMRLKIDCETVHSTYEHYFEELDLTDYQPNFETPLYYEFKKPIRWVKNVVITIEDVRTGSETHDTFISELYLIGKKDD